MQDEDNSGTHILFPESPSGKTICVERVNCFQQLGPSKAASIRRPALAAAFASAASTSATTGHGAIGNLHLSFAVVPLVVVADRITLAQTFGTIALFDVDEYILSAIIWRDETEAPVIHELLNCAGHRHREQARWDF